MSINLLADTCVMNWNHEFANNVARYLPQDDDDYKTIRGLLALYLDGDIDGAIISSQPSWQKFAAANKNLLQQILSDVYQYQIDSGEQRKQVNKQLLQRLFAKLARKAKTANSLQYYKIRLASSSGMKELPGLQNLAAIWRILFQLLGNKSQTTSCFQQLTKELYQDGLLEMERDAYRVGFILTPNGSLAITVENTLGEDPTGAAFRWCEVCTSLDQIEQMLSQIAYRADEGTIVHALPPLSPRDDEHE